MKSVPARVGAWIKRSAAQVDRWTHLLTQVVLTSSNEI